MYYYFVDGLWWRDGCRVTGPAPAGYLLVYRTDDGAESWRSREWCAKHAPHLLANP